MSERQDYINETTMDSADQPGDLVERLEQDEFADCDDSGAQHHELSPADKAFAEQMFAYADRARLLVGGLDW